MIQLALFYFLIPLFLGREPPNFNLYLAYIFHFTYHVVQCLGELLGVNTHL